jgi:hypothetical protein
MTVGYLPFHVWILSKFPTTVHSFEMFNDANPFDPIKLRGAVTNPSTDDLELHGALTAVIRYTLHHAPTADEPNLLSVALGHDVEVNTILGWPSFLAFGMDLLATQDVVASATLNDRFKITRRATIKGLPANTIFDDSTFLQSSAFKAIKHSLGPSPPISATDSTSNGYLQRSIDLD